MIRTTALVKRFGQVMAVDGVDLDVAPGDIYGFLGANGSGKTTTVRMLLGLITPTAGRIEILGQPMPRAARDVLPQVGALIEGPAAYGHLSGAANLTLLDAAGVREHARADGSTPPRSRRARRERVEAALLEVGLGHVGRRPVKNYSLGMRQRLGIAGALLRAPKLLILDEPTNGLDPQGIREIRDLMLDLHRRGTTILVSSHLLAEVEELCTRVGVLDRGRLVLQEELAVLKAPTGRVTITTPDLAQAADRLGRRVVGRSDDVLIVDLAGARPEDLNTELVRNGIRVSSLIAEQRRLEDVVLEAAGRSGDRIGEARPRDHENRDSGHAPHYAYQRSAPGTDEPEDLL